MAAGRLGTGTSYGAREPFGTQKHTFVQRQKQLSQHRFARRRSSEKQAIDIRSQASRMIFPFKSPRPTALDEKRQNL